MKRKTPKVEAWAIVAADGRMLDVMMVKRGTPTAMFGKFVRLIPADPARDAVVKAAAQWSAARERLTRLEEAGASAHAIAKAENELANWSAWLSLKSAAVEKTERKRGAA